MRRIESNQKRKRVRERPLNPIVGKVLTLSPNLNLYKIVVFPAASKPTI